MERKMLPERVVSRRSLPLELSVRSSCFGGLRPGHPRYMIEGSGRNGMHDLLLVRFGSLEHCNALSEPKHGDSIGHVEDVVEVVGDDHDSEPPLSKAANEIQDLPGLRHSERSRGLVQDHQ